jgi:alcohol dehydrogenase class IV
LAVYDLVQKLKIPTLKGTGISSEDLDSLAGQAYQNSSTPDNTRKIGEADYLVLFRKAFDEEDPL